LIKKFKTTSILIIASTVLLGGCGNLSKIPKKISTPSIGFVDNKYRICRDNCPVRTIKYLDDTDPIPLTTSDDPVLAGANPKKLSSEEVAMPNMEKQTEDFIITFEFGKSTPTKDGRDTLKHLLKSARTTSGIALFGATDDIGEKNYNDKLAFKRAHFVARWLKERGIDSKISVHAKGECCHPSPYQKTEKSFSKKRRVEAKVQRNQDKKGQL